MKKILININSILQLAYRKLYAKMYLDNVLINILFIMIFFSLNSNSLIAQSGACDGTVPVFVVDLSSSPSAVWSQVGVNRDGSCCSYAHPPNSCVKFILTLHSSARSIIFSVTDGALPQNLEWQLMNTVGDICDTTKYPADVPVCMSGQGPHTIIFCKPGGNGNTYTITSVPANAATINSSFNGCGYLLDAGTEWNSYFWNTGDTTQTITAQDSGWYWVDASSINCSSKRDSIYVAYNPPISLGNDTSICFGQTVSLSPGNNFAFYEWSNGISGATASSITVGGGTYSVTVTDSSACTSSASIRIIEEANLLVNITGTNVKCIGEQNGSVNITISGGIAPYLYNWSNGFTTEDISSLTTGVYSVIVTDNIGCSATESVTIYEPSTFDVSALISDISCFEGNDGAIDITVSGGTSPYSYTWSNGAITADINNLIAGIYTVTIYDSNMCNVTYQAEVEKPSIFLSAYAIGNNVSCKGGADGYINLSVSGGTSPYIFFWNNSETSQNIYNVLSGTYSVTVTDSNGCITTSSTEVYEPENDIQMDVVVKDANCLGNLDGAIDISVFGGTPYFSFYWNIGQISEDIDGIGAGTYNVTITDINNCSTSSTVFVNEPNDLIINESHIDISCFGGNDGSILTNPSGGTMPYSYIWNTGETTASLSNLYSGNYNVTLTDSSFCENRSVILLTQPSAILAVLFPYNVKCKGNNDGSINLNVSGGVSPYSFIWSNGALTEDISSLTVGSYSVTITDANGCSTTASTSISEPLNNLSASIVVTNLSCFNSSNGSLNLSVSGGTSGYTYLWSNGLTNEDITSLQAGAYSVTVTDANLCTTIVSATLTEPSEIIITSSQTNSTCGSATGTADVAISGGLSPYTYLWSNNSTSSSLTNLSAGAYTISVTDANSCLNTKTLNILDTNAPSITVLSSSNVTCYGASNGSASISASGGITPYSYQWSSGGATTSVSGLAGGTYNVSVIDNNGCISNSSIVISEPSQITKFLIARNVNCYGGSDGAVNLIVSGGTLPYSYLWSSGQTIEDLNNILSGAYSVTITDANSCQTASSVTVTQPAAALVTSLSVTNVKCFGASNGSINLTVLGGTQPYSYLWSSGQNSEDLNNIPASAYTVTVTDANLCTKTTSVTITEPAVLAVSSITGTNVSCSGGTNGSVDLEVTGGTPNYSYNWNFGQITQDLSNISAGVYEGTVTDTKSCTVSTSITISEPASSLTATISKTNVKCNGGNSGAVNLTVSGGTPPYIYLWNSGQATQDLSNIAAGVYTVTVTDTKLCNFVASTTITQPSVLTASIIGSAVSCYGGSDGEANLTVSGGTPLYSYQWNVGHITEDISNLFAGVYVVTITDAKLCKVTSSVTITQQLAITTSYTKVNVNCKNGNNGSIDLTVSGGIVPYTYLWNTGQNTQDISSLIDDIYEVTITDANYCTANSSIIISEPVDILSVSINSTNLKCRNGADGSAECVAIGGTATYTYLWSNGATTIGVTGLAAGAISVTVTDVNNCSATSSVTVSQPATVLALSSVLTNINCNNATTGAINLTTSGGLSPYTYIWSNGSMTEDISILQAGTYYVTVTDANSCIKTTSATLTEPSAFSVTESITNTNCGSSVGSASITVTGATSPYTYLWSNGSITNSISNVASGAYTVTITDNNLCTEIETININDIGGPTISISFASDVKCNGDGNGKAVVYISSGLGPFTYLWSAGSNTTVQDNLSGGTYTVTVTDINGCISTESVIINEPDAITSIAYAPNVCDASSKGFIDLSVYGGVVNYSYLWSNGATSQDILNLNAGIYTVTITDVNSCTLVESVTISIPAITLTPTVVQTNVKCKSGTDGSIDLSVAGGSPAYTYLWNTGLTSQDITGLLAGIYEVTVTDAISCKATASVTLTEPLPLISSISKTNVDCYSATTGSINLTVQGGTAGYTYLWSNAQTTEDISNLIANSYTVTITDANACKLVSSTVITEPTAITSSITGTNVKCFGANGGAANLTVGGGSPVYTYSWSNGSTTEDLNNVIAGNYSVTIIDSKACQNVANVTITQPTQLTVNITKTDVNCYGGSDGNVNITASGGTPNYSYLWNFGQISEDLNNVQSNTYQVTVTDANLCTTSGSIFVNQPASALSASISKTNVSCFGLSDGLINLSVSGGTPNYFYAWSHGFSTEDVNNLASANYTVTVSDNNGCTTTVTTTITQPTAISSTSSITNVKCNGGATGSINLTPTGGTPQYTYLWNNGQASEDASSLAAGNYSVTITDANLCTGTSSYTITQPTQLSASLTGTNLNCYGQYNGQVDLTVSGGTPIYTYLWNDGTTTQDLNNISGGSYNVTVTDVNQCTAYNSITITEPPILTSNAIISNVKCFGQSTGNINLIVSGGTPNYSYTWLSGATIEDLTNIAAGNYSVTITDDNSCQSIYSTTITQPAAALSTNFTKTNVSCYNGTNGAVDLTVTGGIVTYSYLWSNGSVTQDLTNKTAGTYSVTVTDANSCQTSTSVTITQPDSLYTTHTSVDVSCYSGSTGSVNITTQGGTPAYSYAWNSLQITEDLSNIAAGTYTLILTDFNNCKAYDTITISQPLAALTTSYTSQNVLCFGGNNASIDLSVLGGTTPYTYLWNYGQTTQDLSSLTSGFYDVTVTDILGCKSYRSVTITQPAVLTSSIVKTNVNCYNELNGNADLSVSGGTSPYSYIWNSGQTTQDLTNVGFGNYSVTITDTLGCNSYSTITITQPDTLFATSTVNNVACYGNSTGNIYLDVFGGTPPYIFNWSSGQTIEDLQNIPSGVYSLTITDTKLCKTYNTVTVTQPIATLSNSYTSQNVLCNGGSSGSIDLSVAGGTSPYTYYWSNGLTTQDLTNIVAGNYSVTVTDSKSCKSISDALIIEPSAILSSIIVTNVKCNGNSDGATNLTVAGGTSPYSYLWNNSLVSEDLSNIPSGVYSVTITDSNLCQNVASTTVTQPNILTSTYSVVNVGCKGDSTASVNLTVTGGTPMYAYLWNFGQITEDVSGIPAGIYSVTITDTKNCKAYSNLTITEPASDLTTMIAKTDVKCFGGNSGIADLTTNGGTSPYTYAWNFGQTSQDLNNITAGNYCVTVTDSKNCTSSSCVTISQPTAISATFIETKVKCKGNSTGGLNLTPAGGVPPYTFVWSNGTTTEDITNVQAGVYTVTITDSYLCSFAKSSTVTEPTLPLSAVSTVSNVSCYNGNNGNINITVSGGTPSYSYTWNNGQSSEDISNLQQGVYEVTITDINLCTTSNSVTVTQPTELLLTTTQTNSTCGVADGTASVTATGGTIPYSYLWSNGINTSALVNIPSGLYSVTVTDNKSCNKSASIAVNDEGAPSCNIVSTTDVTCNGNANGAATVLAVGGTGAYTFAWSQGASTTTATGLNGGIYYVSVTDENNCLSTSSVTINEPAVLSGNISTVSVKCKGNSTGSANLTVSGGTPSYLYQWSNGAFTEDISGLLASQYNVTITDSHNCKAYSSVTVTEPAFPVTLSLTKSNVSCNGGSNGSIDLSVFGGTPGYTYIWNFGQSSQDLTGIIAGLYEVTVSDINLCKATTSGFVSEPLPIQIQASITNSTCNGQSNGAVNISVSGGTSPYSYSWSNGAISEDISNIFGGVYSVTITDSNNCTKISSYTVTEPTGLLYSTLATDVKCFGGNTGSIALSVSGGTLPYSYVWSNGETSEDISVLLAGTYTVTIKDSKLCTSIVSTTVSQPAMALATSSNQTNVLCYDGNNGVVSATVIGGTSPYSYMWNYGQTTSSISALVAGLYELTITDKNGCTDFLSTTITEPDEIILSPGQTGSTCGMSNGTASISATGGTSPYLYLWNTTSTSTTISNLSAGAYSVEVTDANNCKSSITINVSDAGSPSVTFTYNNVSCFGLSNGNIDMNVSGGTTPYTYLWNNNATTEDMTNISGGNYSITITDNNGCKSTKSVTVEEPALLTISDTSKNVTCNGFANGFINVSVVGGTQAYNYNWSNSAVTQDLNNISGGTYSLTVTDLNNCTATLNKTISEPTQALSFSLNTNNVKCYNGNDGNINLTVSGGTSGYTYKWNLGQTSEDLNGLIAGNYQVTVTDANGCLLTADTTITHPTILTASVNSTDVKCRNGNDGLIDLSVSGGASPYSYFWANGQTWQDIDTLMAGTYSVTITDENKCKVYTTATISQPIASLSFTYNSTNIKCYGDSTGLIDMTIAGGTPAYSYIWNNGSTSQNITNLVAGNYLLTITDNNGCKLNSGNIAITQPSNALSTSYNSVDVLCYSESNASINLTVSGGTSGYSYLWSSGQITQDLSNIYAGNYSVTVSDANSCRDIQNITITQPTALNAFVVKGDVSCFGYNDGTVDLTVTGGTNPYLYSWNYGQNSQDLSSVSSGTYIVTVTDNHNCRINAYAIVTEPALLTAVITPVNVLCKGASTGIAELVVSGGTVNYSYNWSNGEVTEDLTNVSAGNYSVTITDSKNCFITATATIQEPSTALSSSSIVANVTCNGQSNGAINLTINGGTGTYNYNWNYGQTTQDLDNLAAGNYEVTVTDQNSCILIDSIIISQPNPIILTPVKTNSTCGMSNGSASITVTGGSVPYFYAWSNGSQSQSISSLSAGTYSVTVTDSKGCLKFIYINVNDYGAPVSSISNFNNTSCFGYSDGSATVSAIGGIGTYNYLWTNGQTNATATALSAGIYSVSVSDQNGCLSSSTIEIEQPEVLSLQFDPVYVSCNGGTNGAINLTVSGGTSPYSYLWNYGQTIQDLFNLSSGNYEVTVTDSKLCKATDNINITQPNQVVNVTTSKTNVSCNGGNNGAINLTVSGGTPPYSYLWNNGFTNEDISGLTAGSYEVTVTDSKGCNTVKSININQPNAILVTSVVTNVSCKYGNNAAVDITVSGGTSPYYYLWSNGVMSQNVSNLIAGNYSLTLADNLGCENISNYTITEPSILVAYINSSPVTCFGENNGEATVVVSGGTAPYSYLWNNFSTSEDIQDLTVGNYSVTVTDAKACDTTLSVNINQPSSQIIANINSVNVSCYGGSDGFIDLSVSGGTPGYIYTWNYGQTSQDLSNLNARTYQVTITDANGCDTTLSQIITQPSQISLTPIATYSACNDSTGMATVSVSGGVSPYSYYWSTGSFLDSLIDIPSDAYSVSVTDMNGCIKTITVNVNDLGAPELTLTHTNVTCFGMADGSIDLTLSGSINLPMNYNWSSGAATEDLSNLSGGQYFVTVSDINNCKAFDYDKVNEFDLIRTAVSGTNVSCYHIFDGSINLTVTGGTGAGSYTYIWSNSATSEDQSNIAAGLYFVTITDANGCDVVDSINIVQPADSIEASFVSTNVSCYGYSDALINLTVSGGSPNYTYLWNLGQTTEDISNISTGLHEVTITDAKGCKIVRQITVSQPNQLSLTFATINVSCKGGSDASIDLSVSGGTAPYSYLWNYGQTLEDLDNLDYGIYSVVIKDSLLCSTFANITITEPIKPMLLQISGFDVLCNGQSNGYAFVVSSGGTAPYTYLWSNEATSEYITNIIAGNYSVTATDSNGCMFENSITINEPNDYKIDISKTDVSCYSYHDANIDIEVSGGTQPYYYEWSPGNITQDLLNIASGNYAVTITDANNCSIVTIISITQPTELQLTNTITNVTCYGYSNGEIETNVSGGVSGYTYKWNYGNTTQNITNLYSGLYEVTATDLNGCTIIRNMNVTEPPQISVAPTIENVKCYGENSGQIQLNVTGGTPNYNFSWSNGSVSNILPNITAGQYSISITDNNNCPFDSTIIILQPDSLIASLVASMEADIGSCNGYLTISANGGTPSYSYLWNPNGYTGTTNNSLCPFTTYIITVTDINGCKDTISFYMKQKPPIPKADFDPPESGCPPHTVNFINKSLFATSYLWDFDDGTTDTIENPSHEYLQSGVYIVKLTVYDIYQNESFDMEPVTVYEKPSVAFDVAPTTVTMFEEPIHCYNWTYGGATYLWNFGDGVSSNEVEPIHNYSEEGTYDIFLEAWSENACYDSLTIKDAVTVVTSCIMVFPDAFIPTKEGTLGGNWQNEAFYSNRIFHPVQRKVADYKLEIYDRWGQLLFVSEDINVGWDGYFNGKLCQQDVYVFKARWTCEDGTQQVKAGDVTLYH